jgi:hypothetical protein
MSDRNLNIGTFEIMPNTIQVDSLQDLYDEVNKLGDGWGVYSGKIAKYLIKTGKEFSIFGYILTNYEYSLVNLVECVYETDARFKSISTEEPKDIKDFENGEEVVMYDEDGREYEVSVNDSRIFDVKKEKASFYICRPI